MPYIKPKQKQALALGSKPIDVGELTYAIQQLLKDYIHISPSYQTYAECLGALEGAKADLINRKLLPHELVKQMENGDVW